MTKLRSSRIAFGLAAAVVSLTAGAPVAAATDGSSRASCMGIELAAISPPGTSAEIEGGAPELVREVRELARSFGLPQGGVVRLIAQAHAGSHEACDAEG